MISDSLVCRALLWIVLLLALLIGAKWMGLDLDPDESASVEQGGVIH